MPIAGLEPLSSEDIRTPPDRRFALARGQADRQQEKAMTIDAPLRIPLRPDAGKTAKIAKAKIAKRSKTTKLKPPPRDRSHIARPLIVCGMGRSGTRMCANVLGNSSLVELQGEVGGPVGTKLVAWLEAVRSQKRADGHQCLYRLARAAFRDSSPGRP